MSETIAFSANGYEFRESGHVYRREEFLGHVAYIGCPAILLTWKQWLEGK